MKKSKQLEKSIMAKFKKDPGIDAAIMQFINSKFPLSVPIKIHLDKIFLSESVVVTLTYNKDKSLPIHSFRQVFSMSDYYDSYGKHWFFHQIEGMCDRFMRNLEDAGLVEPNKPSTAYLNPTFGPWIVSASDIYGNPVLGNDTFVDFAVGITDSVPKGFRLVDNGMFLYPIGSRERGLI